MSALHCGGTSLASAPISSGVSTEGRFGFFGSLTLAAGFRTMTSASTASISSLRRSLSAWSVTQADPLSLCTAPTKFCTACFVIFETGYERSLGPT